ncbi:DMT family transporter [Actinospica robiniae]|uniref:DMT family transporter n=1 Tax=Actinospica robiniae TaxID=304901 RepID=UPI0003F4E14C|nr:DMT family transporter [Actinospica robiniae]
MSLRTDSAPAAEADLGSGPRRPVRARNLATGTVAMTLLGASVGVSRTLTTAPLFTAQALRYLVAGLVLLAMAKRACAALVWPRGREWLWLTGIAAVGLVLFNVAIVRGLDHAEPAVIAVAVACVPIVLGVVGPLLERRVPSRRILIAAATVTAGSALVEGTGRTDAIGLAWAAVVLACEACFTLLAVPVLPRHSAWGVSVHSVWIGAIMFAVLGCATEGPSSVARITASQWAALAYLALMVTAVAFICWYSTVAALGPGAAGVLTGIAPVAAALTGVVLDGRTPAVCVWCGMLVVFCGLAVGLAGGRAITRVPRRRTGPS